LSFIKGIVFNALHELKEGTISIERIGEIQAELKKLIDKKDKKKIMSYLIEAESKYSIDLSTAKNYVGIGGLEKGRVVGTDKPPIEKIDEGLFQVAKEFVEKNPASRKIRFLDADYSASTSRRLTIKLIDDQAIDGVDPEEITLPFFVFGNFKSQGRIISKKIETKQPILLTAIYEEADGKNLIRWFGDSSEKRNLIDSFVESFYVYLYQDNDKQEYLLLSVKELDIGQCKISGMIVRMQEQLKIGEKTTLHSKRDIIFLSEVKPAIVPLSFEEAQGLVKGWNHETLAKNIFGELRHPQWFEKLIASILFCSLRGYDGWPIHFGILAERGTGKSSFLESLANVFDEPSGIADGTTVTLKNLIPNFGGSLPDEGYICRCFRVSIIDEFMRALKRNKSIGAYADNDADLITSILEHKERLAGSGKHDQKLKVRASSKVFLASNPRKNVFSSIVEMASVLDEAFMSRFIWYHQTPEHIKFIKSRENLIRSMDGDPKPKKNNDFISLYDYMVSFKISPQGNLVEELFREIETKVPEKLQGIWEARGRHMVYALIDGVSKYNFIIQQREKFEILPGDYEEAKGLLTVIVGTWGGKSAIDLMNLPVAKRKDYLTGELGTLYEYVCQNSGISIAEMETNKPVKSPSYMAKQLEKIGLVSIIQVGVYRKIYPYWHSIVKNHRTMKEAEVVEFNREAEE